MSLSIDIRTRVLLTAGRDLKRRTDASCGDTHEGMIPVYVRIC